MAPAFELAWPTKGSGWKAHGKYWAEKSSGKGMETLPLGRRGDGARGGYPHVIVGQRFEGHASLWPQLRLVVGCPCVSRRRGTETVVSAVLFGSCGRIRGRPR